MVAVPVGPISSRSPPAATSWLTPAGHHPDPYGVVRRSTSTTSAESRLVFDVPPDVALVAGSLPRTLYGRGASDELYQAAQWPKDLAVLTSAGVHVEEHVFAGGHEWTPAFIEKTGQFIDELLTS